MSNSLQAHGTSSDAPVPQGRKCRNLPAVKEGVVLKRIKLDHPTAITYQTKKNQLKPVVFQNRLPYVIEYTECLNKAEVIVRSIAR